MAGFGFAFAAVRGELDEALAEIERPIANAATAAIKGAAEIGKTKARERIAAAGFSRKWQNAMRGEVYPKTATSTSAAAVLRHAIPYAHVFEDGATIAGKPDLWVPLSSTPKINARTRLTPEAFKGAFGPLISMTRGRRPMLGARLTVSKSAARRGAPYKVTKAGLKSGARREGIVRVVPVFIALTRVTMPKKFDLAGAFSAAADALPGLYEQNLNPEDFS